MSRAFSKVSKAETRRPPSSFMRRILIDRARRKKSEKHGRQRQREELAEVAAPAEGQMTDLLAVDVNLVPCQL